MNSPATLTSEQRQTVRRVLRELGTTTGRPVPYLEEVFRLALAQSCFDVATVLSRLHWLLSPARASGVELLAWSKDTTAATVARQVVYPKAAVFAFIAAHTQLKPATLETIYASVHSATGHGDPAVRLADLAEERILQEMKWWLVDLQFPDYYFAATPPAEIGNQIRLNRSYEMFGMESETYTKLKISYRSPSGTALHWVHRERYLELESELEAEYYQTRQRYNMSVYAHGDLLLYLISGAPAAPAATAFAELAPTTLAHAPEPAVSRRYHRLWDTIRRTGSIVLERSFKAETGEHRLMVGFPVSFINRFLANLSRAMQANDIKVTRKYCSTFGGATPVIIASFYATTPFPEQLLDQLMNISLYPDNRLARLVEAGTLTGQEANFANTVIEYVHQFITQPEANIRLLRERFAGHYDLQEVFRTLQRRVDKDNIPFRNILDAYAERPDLISDLFGIFAAQFAPGTAAGKSAAARAKTVAARREAFSAKLAALPLNNTETEIFRWGLRFVDAVARTNFFLPVKTALAFRLKSDFLRDNDFEATPHGVFMIKGRDFLGYHVRFKEIARGGIRIVRSTTHDDFQNNADSLFEECYNLAYTQNKKNKDIPEGGSKGVILLDYRATGAEAPVTAFKKYVDALLDMLLPVNRDAITGFEEELLFLGPDEGTAELMDWACERARDRGYPYWKGFTTGKHARLGGVSHIDYGMTTRGVHQYVLGILGKLGLRENTITKAQTGGPDGDLGSNEILISTDKTTVIVDGGGVLYDPDGLERGELQRLATARLDSAHFTPAKLGPHGFLVKVGDRNVALPDGTVVASGLSFRNSFHLDPRLRADLFVPCGGRPKSINSTNWRSLLDAEGKPIVKWIVEGANLFITQDARLKLEEKGVILFKDSSTNKGGVTSSSLEVLAGLALDDKTFTTHMAAAGTREPAFRKRYIAEIMELIGRNADLEFEILWRLRQETAQPISTLSDRLSEKINELTMAIEHSALFEEPALRRNVLLAHLPPILVKQAGLPAILKRVPIAYQKAIFARTLARLFVYRFGLNPGYEHYREFINSFAAGADAREKPD